MSLSRRLISIRFLPLAIAVVAVLATACDRPPEAPTSPLQTVGETAALTGEAPELSVSYPGGIMELSWTAVSDADSYRIRSIWPRTCYYDRWGYRRCYTPSGIEDTVTTTTYSNGQPYTGDACVDYEVTPILSDGSFGQSSNKVAVAICD